MTTAEVNTYIELNKLFQETCDHIAELFSKYNEEFNDRIENWHIIDNEVFGTNRYVNGWYSDDEKIEVNFGVRCLSMSDSELKDYAKKFIATEDIFDEDELEDTLDFNNASLILDEKSRELFNALKTEKERKKFLDDIKKQLTDQNDEELKK